MPKPLSSLAKHVPRSSGVNSRLSTLCTLARERARASARSKVRGKGHAKVHKDHGSRAKARCGLRLMTVASSRA